MIKCQGECCKRNECFGDIKEVVVYGTFCPTGMEFSYCQKAREEHTRRGFRVEKIDEFGLTRADYEHYIAHHNA